jgi:hypothetical protein
MDWTLIPDWIVAAATAISVIVAVSIYWKQTKVSVFLEYTKRYQEIMAAKPLAKWRLKTNESYGIPKNPKKYACLQVALLNYLNLCSEEFGLKNKKWLNKGTWETWQEEMIRTLRTPLLVDEWKKNLRCEFDSYREFQNFVDDIQKAKCPWTNNRIGIKHR